MFKRLLSRDDRRDREGPRQQATGSAQATPDSGPYQALDEETRRKAELETMRRVRMSNTTTVEPLDYELSRRFVPAVPPLPAPRPQADNDSLSMRQRVEPLDPKLNQKMELEVSGNSKRYANNWPGQVSGFPPQQFDTRTSNDDEAKTTNDRKVQPSHLVELDAILQHGQRDKPDAAIRRDRSTQESPAPLPTVVVNEGDTNNSLNHNLKQLSGDLVRPTEGNTATLLAQELQPFQVARSTANEESPRSSVSQNTKGSGLGIHLSPRESSSQDDSTMRPSSKVFFKQSSSLLADGGSTPTFPHRRNPSTSSPPANDQDTWPPRERNLNSPTWMPDDPRRQSLADRRTSSAWSATSGSASLARPRILSHSSVGILGEKAYMYNELVDGFEFRLVRLFPAKMSGVRCEIIHADLINPPEYIALSYAWGDATETKPIQIGKTTIPITASLHGALAALRHKTQEVLVWADALSIDQHNRDERTQQVKLMTEIYSMATRVAVWLGSERDDSDIALDFLSKIYTASRQESTEMTRLIEASAKTRQLLAVVALFERAYWQRLWVVQEVLNAKEIFVYCGTTCLDWRVYMTVSEAFTRHRSDIDRYYPGGLYDESGKLWQSANQFSYSQVLIHQGPGSFSNLKPILNLGDISLLQVLRLCRKKLAFDPRDKVFGILGVLPENIRDNFRVDYSLSAKEAYTDVVDYLLSTTERVDIICEAIYFPLCSSSMKLPTWVPDWSHVPQTTGLGLSYGFSAGEDTNVEFKFQDEQRTKLQLAAVPLSKIACHGVAVGTLCATADYLMAFLHWRALLLGANDITGVKDALNNLSFQQAFCTTICLDQVPPQWKDNLREIVYHLFSYLLSTRLPYLPLDHQLISYTMAPLGISNQECRNLLHKHIGVRMMGRCFCLTSDGSLGMGTGFMAPGDEIVVPLGCRTPILLRREGGNGEYRLVGDVYIHGYMRGLAIQQWRAGERKLKKYVIH